MKEKILNILKDAFDLKWDSNDHKGIREEVLNGSRIQGTNLSILILAILIASIGLNNNSTPVIIGAMLISPLMGNIIAFSFGIAVGELRVSRNAAIGLGFQVVISILTSTIYFAITPINTVTSEILARTTPTFYDVLIAIFGGLAGIIGITRKEKTNVIPGVAIATALMPPLCTAGYGLGTGQLRYFVGAIYLFFINSFFIALTSIFIMRLIKLPRVSYESKVDRRKFLRSMSIIALVTILPSVYIGYGIIQDNITENNTQKYIASEFEFENTQIVSTKYKNEEKILEIALVGKRLDEVSIKNIISKKENYDLEEINVKIMQTEIPDGITKNELNDILAETQTLVDQKTQLTLKDAKITELNSMIEEKNSEISLGLLKLKQAENKIEELEIEIKELNKEEYDTMAIITELNALYPELSNIEIGTVYYKKDNKITKTTALIANTSKTIREDEKTKIIEWLKIRTNKENIEILISKK